MQLVALNHLRNIFGLGKREAEAIMLDITSTLYRKRLAKSFNTELADAPSKAAFLQNLCEELHFDPENASKIHEGTCFFFMPYCVICVHVMQIKPIYSCRVFNVLSHSDAAFKFCRNLPAKTPTVCS